MGRKKEPKADLQNKRLLFFEIGLTAALAGVIVLFGVGQKKIVISGEFKPLDNASIVELPPATKERPKEQVKLLAPNVDYDVIVLVDNDTKTISGPAFPFLDIGDVFVAPQPIIEEPAIVEDIPVLRSDQMPEFMGGDQNAFRKWVMERIVYPRIAVETGINGRVVVSFVIEKNGALSNIEVLQSPDRSLSDEAIRVLSESPAWVPGSTKGIPMRVKFVIPVDFQLAN